MATSETATLDRDLTIKLMPESDEHTLCLEVTGLIRKRDHQANVVRHLAAMVKKYGWYNLLVNYDPSFRGWEADAADSSMQSIMEYGKYARRLAYVNPSKKSIFRYKMSAPLLGGEILYFNTEDLQEAIEWVKGGEKPVA